MKRLKNYESFKKINEDNSSLINQILQLDDELEKDPLYKEYERIFIREIYGQELQHAAEMIFRLKGLDPSMESSEQLEELISTMIDNILSGSEDAKKRMRRDENSLKMSKNNIIKMVDRIIKLAELDQEFRLCAKLKKFNDLMKQI